jgi:hypothetical protein
MSPNPELVILETCYYSNNEYIQSRDYYLIKGEWDIQDLSFYNGCILYKGKVVTCPMIEVCDLLELSPEQDIEYDEEPELRIVEDDWDSMFEGHTIDEISVE